MTTATTTADGTTTIEFFINNFKVNASGGGGNSGASFVTTDLPEGRVGEAYTLTLESQGGVGPFIWGAQDLPTGITLDGETGVVSGTPVDAASSVDHDCDNSTSASGLPAASSRIRCRAASESPSAWRSSTSVDRGSSRGATASSGKLPSEKLLATPSDKDVLGMRDRAMLETLYSTGIRVSELVDLNLEDFDDNGEAMKVRGKGKRERVVPLGTHAIAAIRRYMDLARSDPRFAAIWNEGGGRKPLFVNKHGKRLSSRSVRRKSFH